MSVLQKLGIVVGENKKAANIFERICPDFRDVRFNKPSEYVRQLWSNYERNSDDANNNLNGKIFEYILATLLIRENILPFYLGAKVAFVPNVIYDLMLYTRECGPICLSAKTSLRERYKQADLEAIALKYVHRKARSYLITLSEGEASSVKQKIKSGDVIGLDDVVVASNPEFDVLVTYLKKIELSDPPSVRVIESSQTVTKAKVEALGNA